MIGPIHSEMQVKYYISHHFTLVSYLTSSSNTQKSDFVVEPPFFVKLKIKFHHQQTNSHTYLFADGANVFYQSLGYSFMSFTAEKIYPGLS